MHSRRSFLAPLVFAIALLTSTLAHAQLYATTEAFGHHGGGSDIPDNLVLIPIGRAECDVVIPFDFSGLSLASTPRYVDVWRSASETVTCNAAASRLSGGTCTPVTFEQGVNERDGASTTFTMGVTPRELFGDCVSSSGTFWFIDAAASPDLVTTSLPGAFTHLDIALDADAPNAPTIPASVYGDETITLSWIDPPDLPEATAMFVYFDPDGCGGDDAGVAHAASSVLIAGAAAPQGYLATEYFFPYSVTTMDMAAESFGWSSAHYAEQGAIAITVLDPGYNESVLSNVVCIAHLPAAAAGADASTPDGGMGDGRYRIRACSIGGRPQPLALAPIIVALVLGSWRRVGRARAEVRVRRRSA